MAAILGSFPETRHSATGPIAVICAGTAGARLCVDSDPALGAMCIIVASGLAGKYLLGRVQKRNALNRRALADAGMVQEDIAEQVRFDTMTFNAIKQ
jgi:hypothetical protein